MTDSQWDAWIAVTFPAKERPEEAPRCIGCACNVVVTNTRPTSAHCAKHRKTHRKLFRYGLRCTEQNTADTPDVRKWLCTWERSHPVHWRTNCLHTSLHCPSHTSSRKRSSQEADAHSSPCNWTSGLGRRRCYSAWSSGLHILCTRDTKS